jgi:hypothetical protein
MSRAFLPDDCEITCPLVGMTREARSNLEELLSRSEDQCRQSQEVCRATLKPQSKHAAKLQEERAAKRLAKLQAALAAMQFKDAKKQDKRALTITLLVTDNPKRIGSHAYGRFELYESGMTVQAALDVGLTPEDFRWDIAHGYISIK